MIFGLRGIKSDDYDLVKLNIDLQKQDKNYDDGFYCFSNISSSSNLVNG